MINETQHPEVQRLFRQSAEEIEIPANLGERAGPANSPSAARSRRWAIGGAAAAVILGVVAIALIRPDDQPPSSAVEASVAPSSVFEAGAASWDTTGIPTFEIDLDFSGSVVTFKRGTNDGIEVGMPVVDASGLIGKVASVTDETSTVLLITQSEFSIAAQFDDSPDLYTISGTPDDGLVLRGETVLDESALDRVLVTTGGSSIAPPGIPVGIVDSIIDGERDENVLATIRPFDTFGQFTNVNVILYRPVSGENTASDNGGMGVDPAALPDGLVVWDVANGVSAMREVMTMQLFAESVPDGEPIDRGVIVTVSPLNNTEADSTIPTTMVRGQRGLLLGDDMLAWDENGVSLMARSKNLTVDETTAVLDRLVFHAQPLDGLDPGPASEFELVTETTSGPTHLDTLTFFRLGQPDRVPGLYEITAETEPPSVIIGTGYSLAAPPEILLYGQPQDDGTIEAPLLAYGFDDPQYARYRLNDDSSVTMVSGDTPDERAAVMNATRLLSGDELEAIVDDISTRVAELPEVATYDFEEFRVVARGGSIDEPTALCVDTQSGAACRLTFKVPVTSGQVTVNEQTYIIAIQHDGPPIAVAEWEPVLALTLPAADALPSETSAASDGTIYTATRVPNSIDTTVIGIITDGQITFPVGNQSGTPRLTALR